MVDKIPYVYHQLLVNLIEYLSVCKLTLSLAKFSSIFNIYDDTINNCYIHLILVHFFEILTPLLLSINLNLLIKY